MPPAPADRRFARPGDFIRWVALRIFGIAFQVAVVAIIVGTIGAVGFIEYSAQPGFCKKCHIMVPYYESWATSSHNDVACIKCHYAPGIKAEAMGKFQAANQVVRYVTGTYGLKPWAEIEDAACLRSGCHEQRKLEGVVNFRGIRFDHAQHLGQLRRGKQLRCTSCHSQIVQGEHLRVTETTCYLCHFKDEAAGEPVAGCVGCHASPPQLVSPAGFVVDHEQYVEDLVSCLSCHDRVVEGSGAADESRCFNCHNEPERIEQFTNTELMHRIHIAERNVECTQCHVPMEHRIASVTPALELDCQACHSRVHDAQQRLYAGLGGHATGDAPSAMFLAKVTCTGCHELTAEIRGHEQVQLAGEASCLSCHGIRYADILPGWQDELARRLAEVTTVVEGARARVRDAGPQRRASIDSVVRLAEENVQLVRLGKGAHNIVFADDLLRAALTLVGQAVDAGLPYEVPRADVGPDLSGNQCLQCHLGVERRAVPFRGRLFQHERHVVEAGVACSSCHTGMERHGGTMLQSAAACSTCHHRDDRPESCPACHAGAAGAPDTALALSIGEFPHDRHREVGLSCTLCHAASAMSADETTCLNCHAFHHQPDATCRSCHRRDVQALHDRTIAHGACSRCHGDAVGGIDRWSREVCTTCHVDRVEHNAPLDCAGCHTMPAIALPADRGADPAPESRPRGSLPGR